MAALRWLLPLLAALLLLGNGARGSDDHAVALTSKDFNTRVPVWEVTVVIFYTKWCPQSSALMPKIEAAAKELNRQEGSLHAPATGAGSGHGVKLALAKADAAADPELRHMHRISSLPAIIIFVKGVQVDRYQGAVTPEAIRAYVEQLRGKIKSGALPKTAAATEQAPAPANAVAHLHGELISLTAATFDQDLRSHQYAVVNFGAPWCKWTRALLPEFARAGEILGERQAGVLMATVDCEKERMLEHKYRIREFPTILFFRCGKPVGRYIGARSADAIAGFVERWVHDSRGDMMGAVACANAQTKGIAPGGSVVAVAVEANGSDSVEASDKQAAALLLAVCVFVFLALLTIVTIVLSPRCSPPVDEDEPRLHWWHYASGMYHTMQPPITESSKPKDPIAAGIEVGGAKKLVGSGVIYEPVFVHEVDIDADAEPEESDRDLSEAGPLMP